MNTQDTDYYRLRAARERQAARSASQSYIADIHLELARSYEALVKHPELRASVRVDAGRPLAN